MTESISSLSFQEKNYDQNDTRLEAPHQHFEHARSVLSWLRLDKEGRVAHVARILAEDGTGTATQRLCDLGVSKETLLPR